MPGRNGASERRRLERSGRRSTDLPMVVDRPSRGERCDAERPHGDRSYVCRRSPGHVRPATGLAGQTVTLTLAGTGGFTSGSSIASVVLTLFSPSGASVGGTLRSNGQGNFVLPETGTYVVRVNAINFATTFTMCSARFLRTAVKWGHLQENPARGVDLPALKCVRPKWALTTSQAASLLAALPPLARAMVGLAILSGLRRGELFALRWRDIDDHKCLLSVREAVYDGTFGTPKTEAGTRQIPLSTTALRLVLEWKGGARTAEPDAFVFGTRSGSPISPNNVLRRGIFPVCHRLGLPRATWLTFRRTYSSWSHEKGVPGKVVAQLMGHANVDTTLNVYTQVLDGSVREAVEKIGGELFTIVHNPGRAVTVTD